MLKIDSHHHLWDLGVRDQGWITGQDMAPIRRNFLIEDLKEALKSTGITKTVVVQTVTEYSETPELLKLAAKEDLIAGVVGWLNIDSPDVIEHLDKYQSSIGANYLKGIRDIAQDHPDSNYLARPQAIKTVQELGRRGLTYDLLTKTPELPGAIEMVRQCPDVQFVLDHISKPYIAKGEIQPWASFIKELASFENVVCKVSGMVTEANWKSWRQEDFLPYFEVIVNAFTPKRLMFGSDWPVANLATTYGELINLVEFLIENFSGPEKSDIWANTANNSYKLGL
jgi:L-fuconolactonase